MTEDDEQAPSRHSSPREPADGGKGGDGRTRAHAEKDGVEGGDQGGDGGDGNAQGGNHGEAHGGGAGGHGHGRGPGPGPGPGSGPGGCPGGVDDPGAAQPARRLTRSRRPKTVAGVCSGLGRYFDLDPVIFRVPLVVLSVVGGLGLVFYGAAWLLIPAEGERQNEARWLLSGRVEGTTLSAILVALVGCGLFLASLGNRSTPFSLLLVAAVAGAAYWSHHRREAEAAEAVGAPVDPATAHAVADAPPETQAPPVPATPSWWREPLTKDGVGGHGDTGYLWGPEDARTGAGWGDPYATGVPWGGGRPRRRGRDGRRRDRTFGGLVAMTASAAAVAGAAPLWESRPIGTSLTVGLACALAVYGIGFAVSAFAGRIGFGSVFLTVVTAALLAGASLLPKSIGTDWRDVTWAPSSASDVARTYDLDGGSGELDLTGVRFTGDGKSVRTRVQVGAGALKVVVPRGTRVELDADVAAGEIRLPTQTDREGDHFVVESFGGLARHERLSLPPSGTRKEKGTLKLSVDMTAGQVEIVRLLPSGERTDHVPVHTVPRDERGEDGR
ncbi:PspC domain-containing protein [Streptomyces winkii]|uniref:PspC domain-containing protein n=1 Tax=Streptomyces winkii TaxID=3051178 RepID=UPI0028D30D6C|nr:PspC domain-containing protein [Streptomyces sp. DSM 40971]